MAKMMLTMLLATLLSTCLAASGAERLTTTGWYASAVESSCKVACEAIGLVCTEDGLHSHNSDVDTAAEVLALIAQLGGSTDDARCQGRWGSHAAVPNWKSGFCAQSSGSRAQSSFDCAAAAGESKRRLCYCHEAPTAAPTTKAPTAPPTTEALTAAPTTEACSLAELECPTPGCWRSTPCRYADKCVSGIECSCPAHDSDGQQVYEKPQCPTASTPAPPTPAPTHAETQAQYHKLAYGAASCPTGAAITTLSECELAVASLGITELQTSWIGVNSRIPVGCSVRENCVLAPNGQNKPKAHFNSQTVGAGRADLAPICQGAATIAQTTSEPPRAPTACPTEAPSAEAHACGPCNTYTRCTEEKCRECSFCSTLEQKCQLEWCTRNNEEWPMKCTWRKCGGCDACLANRRLLSTDDTLRGVRDGGFRGAVMV